MMEKRPEYYLNRAVTNHWEQAEFALLLLAHGLLFVKVMMNFSNVIKWHLKIRMLPGALYCVNLNLILLSLIKILVLSYALLAGIFNDAFADQGVDYYNVVTYTYLSQLYIIFFNLTIVIVAKSWLIVLKIRYPKHERIFPPLVFAISAYNILISLTSFTILNCALAFRDLISVNYYLDIISSTLSGVIFVVSLLNFQWSTRNVISVTPSVKKSLKCLNILLMLAMTNRILTFLVRLYIVDILLDLKNYDEGEQRDGVAWAFISFEYFAICDFMPILILSSLFTPKISSDKKCVLAESQIEIEQEPCKN